jgi:two-component system, cell cycle sensor histidine kinase and response regulator CckA
MMMTPDAAAAPNQIAFGFMSEPNAAGLSGTQNSYNLDVAGEAEARASIVPVICVMAGAGTVLLALVATQASEPFLLTLLASLAMLGVFFVFGLIAGHIRIGERIRYDDLIAAFTENLDAGLLLTSRDGTVHYANTRLGDLIGRTPSGDPVSLDVAFGSEAAPTEALFRLMRATSASHASRSTWLVKNATWARWCRGPCPTSQQSVPAILAGWQVSKLLPACMINRPLVSCRLMLRAACVTPTRLS